MIASALAYLRHRHDLVKREDAATMAVARYAAETAKLRQQLKDLQSQHSHTVYWAFWNCPDEKAHQEALQERSRLLWSSRSAQLRLDDVQRRIKKHTTKKQRRKWGISV